MAAARECAAAAVTGVAGREAGAALDGERTFPAAAIACFGGLLLPWLNPFATGPSTWVGPWLIGAICTAAVFGVSRAATPRAGVTAALGGLAAWGLLRSGWSPETLALAASCAIVWLMAAFTGNQARQGSLVRVVAIVWLVAALVSTGAALLQYFGLADALDPFVNVSANGEAFANLRQRNQFASLTAIGMAALLWLAPGISRRWLAFLGMAWLAAGDAATTSRTGLLELLLIGGATICWTGWRSARLQLWAAALCAYLAAAFALPMLADAAGLAQNPVWLRVTDADPCSSRLVLWSNVLHLIAQRPWLGWGWGELDYAHYTTLYGGTRFCDILDNAHNLPLHLAVELGIPAACALCGFVAWSVWRARPWSERDAGRQMAWTVLLVLGVHSMLEYPLWYAPFQMALGLALGLLSSSAGTRDPAATWPWWVAPAVAALALAGAGYAAWDYHRASQVYLPEEQRSPRWRHDPLEQARSSWIFRQQVGFAELTLTPLTRNNARWTYERAQALLHYSPEPRVIEKLIESAMLVGREDVALGQLARFRAAFPEAYAAWSEANRRSARP
jgi:O-antigen ligase